MSDDIKVNHNVTIPGWEIWQTTSTSGGPGGQHANRSETRVTLHWVPADTSAVSGRQKSRMVNRLRSRLTTDGELQVSSQETRSQKRNAEDARERFGQIVNKALRRSKRRKRTRPTRASKERRLKNKKHRGRIKSLRKTPKIPDY